MNLAVMFTGGKDSCFALWYALHQGWNIKALITVSSDNPQSYMFHHPNISWTNVQAMALDIQHHFIYTKGLKEVEVQDLKRGLIEIKCFYPIHGIVIGGISSDYQKARFDRICEELGLLSLSPLWRKDPLELIHEEVELGFEILITACMARGLDERWLGRKIDGETLKELEDIAVKYGVDPAFEGGEAETFVTDGPLFKKKLVITQYEKIWRGDSGVYQLVDVKLKNK